MKTVKLNGPIYDLEGNIMTGIKWIFKDDSRVKMEYPIHFCDRIYEKLLNSRTNDNEETNLYFDLARKMHNISSGPEMMVLLTDEEVDICNKMLQNDKLVIKGRFLEMIEELNGEGVKWSENEEKQPQNKKENNDQEEDSGNTGTIITEDSGVTETETETEIYANHIDNPEVVEFNSGVYL